MSATSRKLRMAPRRVVNPQADMLAIERSFVPLMEAFAERRNPRLYAWVNGHRGAILRVAASVPWLRAWSTLKQAWGTLTWKIPGSDWGVSLSALEATLPDGSDAWRLRFHFTNKKQNRSCYHDTPESYRDVDDVILSLLHSPATEGALRRLVDQIDAAMSLPITDPARNIDALLSQIIGRWIDAASRDPGADALIPVVPIWGDQAARAGHTATSPSPRPVPKAQTAQVTPDDSESDDADEASWPMQSLLFSKAHFSRKGAVEWANAEGMEISKIEETATDWRLLQRSEHRFASGAPCRTISLDYTGIQAVVAKPIPPHRRS